MASERFDAWLREFEKTGDICPLRLGAPRERVRAVLGEPDDEGGASAKHAPRIWKYGALEFHFGNRDADGLCLICQDSPDGVVRVCIGKRTSIGVAR